MRDRIASFNIINRWTTGGLIFIFVVLVIAAVESQADYSEAWLKETPKIEQVFENTVAEEFAVVFYKEGCPYCEAAQEEVTETARQAPFPVYYVDTESAMGKKLISVTHIKYASTIVVFRTSQNEGKTIHQLLFSESGERKEKFSFTRWSYADKKEGTYVPLTENIKAALNPKE
ncbi:hypothetical protein VNN41_09790 [Lactococcus garvieae]|uniref:hypothetical protein n=1 Tax=Lactococcus garvieae TaxID=1363 RepID=UPI003250982B